MKRTCGVERGRLNTEKRGKVMEVKMQSGG